MMHGYDWNGLADLTGWILTEKMDGCRAYWTGIELWTKSGRPYRNIPAPMLAELQAAGRALDCELWAPDLPRAQSLKLASAAALRGIWSPALRLTVFDLPGHAGPAAARRAALDALPAGELVTIAPWERAADPGAAAWRRAATIARGGEGVMALDPASYYAPGRRPCLLKLK